MATNKWRYAAYIPRMKKMRASWVWIKDIAKMTNKKQGAIERYIYGITTWWYKKTIINEEYISMYVKALIKKIQSVLQLTDDDLIEYISKDRWALFTQLWIIEKKMMECDQSELKELCLKKNKLIQLLDIRFW